MTKTMFQSCCLAAATALAFLTVSPLSAQEALVNFAMGMGPFERSHKRCLTVEELGCAVIQPHATNVYTIKKLMEMYPLSTFSEILILNDWKEGEVTPETIVPKGKRFALK